jgi:hypothetical protein
MWSAGLREPVRDRFGSRRIKVGGRVGHVIDPHRFTKLPRAPVLDAPERLSSPLLIRAKQTRREGRMRGGFRRLLQGLTC